MFFEKNNLVNYDYNFDFTGSSLENLIDNLNGFWGFVNNATIEETKDRMPNYNKAMGILGEKLVNAVSHMFFSKDHKIKHLDWKGDYVHGKGSDIQIYNKKGVLLVDIEVKNWKNQKNPYSYNDFKKQILARFEGSTAQHKILAISHTSLIPDRGLAELSLHGIKVLEIGAMVKSTNFRSLLHSTSKKLLEVFNCCILRKSILSINGILFTINDNIQYSTIDNITNNTIDTKQYLEIENELRLLNNCENDTVFGFYYQQFIKDG